MLLSILCLVMVAGCGVIQGKETGNFPIDGCSTDEMDFLFLCYDGYTITDQFDQHDIARRFAAGIKGSKKANPRVTFAGVCDSFFENRANVNVSTWNFTTSSQFSQYKSGERRYRKMYYDNVNKTIELKIQFARRLFSEMVGVRKNASHIAVIFLYGYHLSYEESRSVPYVVQQYVTDIKIFVVVLHVKYVHLTEVLRDTLLVHKNGRMLGSFLMMVICNQCLEGWFSLRRNDHTHALSCYFVMPTESYSAAASMCLTYYSSLVTIETREELNFLQTHLPAVLKDKGYLRFDPNGYSQLLAQLYIALRKYTNNIAPGFHWSYGLIEQRRPLVVTHWWPGKPSGGFSSRCVVWRFVSNVTWDNITNLPGNESRFVDGWEDVGCEDELNSFSLCEIVLPRRVEDQNMMRLKPASNESVSRTLTKGDFRIYRNNIVSVSANIASRNFVEFLKQTEPNLFPIFDCGVGTPDPRYISYIYVCDSVNHCSNRRDEIYCVDRSPGTKKDDESGKECTGVNCCDGSCLPSRWVGDGEVDCNVCGDNTGNEVNDESVDVVRSSKRNERCALFCNVDGACVRFSQLNDSHTDCKGPEGPLDETIGKLETADTCYNILGHRIWAPRCVYVRDRYGAVLGCRDRSHLKDCVDFECPEGYTKCPDTYCIPQHYVLDGTIDCPSGEEENNYTIGSCTGNFACWNSKMCLHPDLVCNGHHDCPHQDDEVDCHVTCPKGLRCISGTAIKMDYNRSINMNSLYNIDDINRYIDFSHVNLDQFLLFSFFALKNIATIIFSNCSINYLDYAVYDVTSTLQELDLSYNLIQILDGLVSLYPRMGNIRILNVSYNRELDEVYNIQFRFLETLDLSHTSISQLQESFLEMLPSLKHLDLSFTKISNFNKNIFASSPILSTLDLRGLHLNDFYENFFNGLTISQDMYTDRFELCCPQIRGANIPYNTCFAPDDAISSCFDLIGLNVQRVLLWVVAVLAVLGNITVIVYRVIWDRSVLKIGYGMFVTNLGVSDFIMGVYLFIIAGADYYYRDIYVLSDKTWRESFVCRFAGFLATLSSETSTFFVFLITLDRFLVMKFPFGQKKLNEMTKLMLLLLSWTIGFLLALTPVVFRFEIYSSNAMCLGLPLTTKRLYGWEFSFGVFIILNLCLFLLIVYGQKAIFSAMSENRMTQITSRRAEDITVAKQLSLVALSNFLCWFPVGLMGLLSLGGHVISNDVYAWTTVIVLPINAAANPLLYTIPALMAKWERFKTGATRTMQTST